MARPKEMPFPEHAEFETRTVKIPDYFNRELADAGQFNNEPKAQPEGQERVGSYRPKTIIVDGNPMIQRMNRDRLYEELLNEKGPMDNLDVNPVDPLMLFRHYNHVFATRTDYKVTALDNPIHVFMLDGPISVAEESLHFTKDELRLPYSRCIFIVGKEKNVHFKATQLSPVSVEFEVTQLKGYGNDKYLEKRGPLTYAYTLINGTIQANALDRPPKAIHEALQAVLVALINLAERKVVKQAVWKPLAPVTDKRPGAKSGLVFKILDLQLFKIITIKPLPKGGTHASPREHWRRGHWRRLRNGNVLWVKARIVNKGVKGSVHKAYNLIEQLLT